MLCYGILKQVVAASLVAFAVAAPPAAGATSVGLVKRDRPPPGVGGDPKFAPRPTDNPEWPCASGGISRASCMFGTVPKSTPPPPTISTIWVHPVPPAFTPTHFDPSPHRTETVTVAPSVTITVTAGPDQDPEPTASWTEEATWTEEITWTVTMEAAAATALPFSEPAEASEPLVKRSDQVMTKNGKKAAKSETTTSAESTFTTVVEPVFTTVALPDFTTAIAARSSDPVCELACKSDANRPACQESCNKDLVSFTRAECKDYAPSCKADKESEQCMADCASVLPGNNVCAAGCYQAENFEECENSCARDLAAFGAAICHEHGCA